MRDKFEKIIDKLPHKQVGHTLNSRDKLHNFTAFVHGFFHRHEINPFPSSKTEILTSVFKHHHE